MSPGIGTASTSVEIALETHAAFGRAEFEATLRGRQEAVQAWIDEDYTPRTSHAIARSSIYFGDSRGVARRVEDGFAFHLALNPATLPAEYCGDTLLNPLVLPRCYGVSVPDDVRAQATLGWALTFTRSGDDAGREAFRVGFRHSLTRRRQ